MQSDRVCPHCGEVLRAKGGPRPSWILFSLAMAGCPEDVYGAPAPGPETDSAETSTEDGSETEGDSAGGEALPPAVQPSEEP